MISSIRSILSVSSSSDGSTASSGTSTSSTSSRISRIGQHQRHLWHPNPLRTILAFVLLIPIPRRVVPKRQHISSLELQGLVGGYAGSTQACPISLRFKTHSKGKQLPLTWPELRSPCLQAIKSPVFISLTVGNNYAETWDTASLHCWNEQRGFQHATQQQPKTHPMQPLVLTSPREKT